MLEDQQLNNQNNNQEVNNQNNQSSISNEVKERNFKDLIEMANQESTFEPIREYITGIYEDGFREYCSGKIGTSLDEKRKKEILWVYELLCTKKTKEDLMENGMSEGNANMFAKNLKGKTIIFLINLEKKTTSSKSFLQSFFSLFEFSFASTSTKKYSSEYPKKKKIANSSQPDTIPLLHPKMD
jgi:hypothetical protein